MQRHRHNVKVSKLLVGLRPYQAYTKRHPCVTVTLTNHRPFQNRPTLDAKKMHFCSSESRESRIFEISALKTIVLRNKTKPFFDLQLVNCPNGAGMALTGSVRTGLEGKCPGGLNS